MNTRPRLNTTPATALSALVDRALSPEQLTVAVHAEDWPDPGAAAPLPRELWGVALGDVARDILSRPSRQFRARLCELGWRLADGAGEVPPLVPAVVEIVHAGSLIVDDIEDGSRERRGGTALHLEHGLPRAPRRAAFPSGEWRRWWLRRRA